MKRITIERDLSSDPIVCHLVQPADSGSRVITATAAQTRVVRDKLDEILGARPTSADGVALFGPPGFTVRHSGWRTGKEITIGVVGSPDSPPARIVADEAPVRSLRDHLDEILGDREDYKELEAGLRKMAKALHDNVAAQELLGLRPGADIMGGVTEWAKSYQAPRVRKAVEPFVGERCTTPEAPSCLSLQERAEIRELAHHALNTATAGGLRPQEITAGARRVIVAMDRLLDNPSPGLETTVAEALRSVRVEDCDMLEILFAAARDLEWSAPDALGAAEQRLDHLAAHLADAVGSAFPPGLASGASESPGDPGEETGAQRFDPRDPEQTLDAIIDLGRRICVLEGWRRSCAHLPADEEALGALVDEAVERALRPVAHRMSDLESMKINLQGRVHALELHRQGLTDGQAELAAGGLEVTIGGKEYRTAPDGSLSPADEQDYAAAREKIRQARVFLKR